VSIDHALEPSRDDVAFSLAQMRREVSLDTTQVDGLSSRAVRRSEIEVETIRQD
jgi:hypothetical protein